MKNKSYSKLSLVIILLVLLCSCANKEKNISPVVDESSVIVEGNVIEEPTKNSVEEIKEEEVTDDAISEEVIMPYYKLHIGIADGIALNVTRIASKYGTIGEVVAEVTKLYEGDILSAYVTTVINLDPIYCVHDAIKNEDNTFTVANNDITITTGYDYAKNEVTITSNQTLNFLTSTNTGSTKLKIDDVVVYDCSSVSTYIEQQYVVYPGQKVSFDSGNIKLQIFRYNQASGETPADRVFFKPENQNFNQGDNTSGEIFYIEEGYCYYVYVDPQAT